MSNSSSFATLRLCVKYKKVGKERNTAQKGAKAQRDKYDSYNIRFVSNVVCIESSVCCLPLRLCVKYKKVR
jgi:hypothetical protein